MNPTYCHRQRNYVCNVINSSSSGIVAHSKSQNGAPKELLQLRSEVRPLFPFPTYPLPTQHLHRLSDPCDSSSLDSGVLSRLSSSTTSSPSGVNRNLQQKCLLSLKEKQMNPVPPMYQAYDHRAAHYPQRKMTMSSTSSSQQLHQAPPLRTPSSGFSSASSSENMFSVLSLAENDQRIMEMMDPAIEVDLDVFLLPDVRYKQPQPPNPQLPSTSTSRGNVSQISGGGGGGQSHNGSTRQIMSYQTTKNSMPPPMSDYSNIKRSNGYIDYKMPTDHGVKTISHPSSSSIPMSPGNWGVRCQYCWETYVKLCQRVANLDPVVTCDGPWHWHSLYDPQGRVACPRLWFTQIDRAGTDMLEQMGNMRNVPV